MTAAMSKWTHYVSAAVALWVSAPAAHAFTIEHSEARYADKHFHYELIVTLDAPIERVDEVLRNYPDYPSLNARILSSNILERPAPDQVTLETTVEVCFGWFCRNVTRVETVQESKHVLLAVADPERSDVKFSETRSELTSAHHGSTRVRYVTDVVPGFWVPPMGGRRMLLKMLESETRELFMSVEQKARDTEPAPP
ncbi:hypothetical protein [Steroidobacter sp.]|uniref:hypothetical protein n=1 Tax=Steroidobacter sp. TaxID=1978227 RepID=UPI001A551132|nr:hypothetical protein [Steroidobacter sp.]MBL8270396.1 hypothetical protein [Steroidobacter sp.]